jgi:uncharacterized protein DUF2442
MPSVTHARADGYLLWLRFDDGVEGTVDLHFVEPFEGVFAPFADPAYIAGVRVDAESRTVCWPNGADLDPIVLHSKVTGRSIASYWNRPKAPSRRTAARTPRARGKSKT